MTEDYLATARRRVRDERARLEDELAAYGRFATTVESLATTTPEDPPHTASDGDAPAHTVSGVADASAECRRVLRTFAETVGRAVDADEPESPLEAVESELGGEVALALAPTTNHAFTPGVKAAVTEAVADRRRELRTMRRALEREADSLSTAAERVGPVRDAVERLDRTPLLQLGFETLRERHETLVARRERCEEVSRTRQRLLKSATGRDGRVGLSHRTLVEHLYRSLPVDHPVLATVARLDARLAAGQRSVRDHLTRRV